jgi:hypothetical protein
MYRSGRHSVRERIIAAEVMKLERQQAAQRASHRQSHVEQSEVKAASPYSGKRPF